MERWLTQIYCRPSFQKIYKHDLAFCWWLTVCGHTSEWHQHNLFLICYRMLKEVLQSGSMKKSLLKQSLNGRRDLEHFPIVNHNLQEWLPTYQETHHRKITFLDEYKKFPEKFEVDYDERYIFKEPGWNIASLRDFIDVYFIATNILSLTGHSPRQL